MWVDTDGIDLPPIPQIPAPELNGVPLPLADSDMDWSEWIAAFNARREYQTGEGEDAEERLRFRMATVFDVSQTDKVQP
jgi:hypothetical protein